MNIQLFTGFFSKLFTKENITFALAVFGSLGTAYTLFSQRKRFSLSVHYYSYKNRSLLLYVSFTNNSHLPVSISNVSVVIDNVCYPCVYVPTKVWDYTRTVGKEVVSRRETFSIQFPVSLSALAGSSGYIYFDTLPDTYPDAPTEVTLEVSANRGKAKRMKLSVPTN